MGGTRCILFISPYRFYSSRACVYFVLQDEKNEMIHTNMWLNYVSDSCRFCLFSASLSRFLHFVFAYLYFKSPFTVHTGSGAATRCSARQRRTVRCLVCCKPSWLFIIRALLSIGEQNIVMSVSLSDMIMVDPWVGLNLSNTQICLLNRRTAVTAPQIHSNG